MESFHVITGDDPHTNSQIRPDVDPHLFYPSFVPMDRYIDVDRLISPDRYLTEGTEKHAADSRDSPFLKRHRLNEESPYEPDVREIWLTRKISGTLYDHLDRDRNSLWEFTQAAAGLTYNLRAGGHFSDEFRAQNPKREYNAASTPALWATLAREKVHTGGSR